MADATVTANASRVIAAKKKHAHAAPRAATDGLARRGQPFASGVEAQASNLVLERGQGARTGLTHLVEPMWDNVTLLEGNARRKWFEEMRGNFKSLAISTSQCDVALRAAFLGGTSWGAEFIADNPQLLDSGDLRVAIGTQTSHSAYIALEVLKKAHPDFAPNRRRQVKSP